MRYGQDDLAQVLEETLQPPDELPMRYALAAIRVLQWQGESTLAVDYAYRLLRATHFRARGAQGLLGQHDAGQPTGHRRNHGGG